MSFGKNILIKKFIFLLFPLVFFGCSNSDSITDTETNDIPTIVSTYGELSISGVNVVDKNGDVIVLRGMSLFWSQWAPDYYNKETIQWFYDDWKCTIIRIPMGIESGGYLENPEIEFQKITTVIDACIEIGIYVIVDWHDHHGENHLEEAKKFFNDISSIYGSSPNILYEIYNEPLDISWNDVLKNYSEEIISTIRKNDADNIIIVGTPNWSQDVDSIIGNEIEGENIAYSLHFYTGTHTDQLRSKATQAIEADIPVFVSEWGISEATGTGNINTDETNLWAEFMEDNNLSWCNWSVTNKDETSAIILPSTTKLYGWSESELSEAGNIIRDYLIRMNSEIFTSLDE